MTTQLEIIRDCLTILRLSQEVALTQEIRARVVHFTTAYLDANLPAMKEDKK